MYRSLLVQELAVETRFRILEFPDTRVQLPCVIFSPNPTLKAATNSTFKDRSLTLLYYADDKACLNKQRVFVVHTALLSAVILAVSLLHCNALVTELGRFFRVCVALFCSPLESFLFVVTASHFRPRELLVPFPYSRSAAGSTPIPLATPNFLMRFGYIHVYRPGCQDVTTVHHPVTAIVRASLHLSLLAQKH